MTAALSCMELEA